MPRCTKVYKCGSDVQFIMSEVDARLRYFGYVYKNYEGEMVYHKGNGFISNPKCFKVYIEQDCIVMQGWMKWSILPFVAAGEMDYSDNSFVGIFPKKQMQREAGYIEQIILSHPGTFLVTPQNMNNQANQQ